MTTLTTRPTLFTKVRMGRAVLWFYFITLLSVEILRNISNQ